MTQSDEAEGWTDLHFHPIASDWQPTADQLPFLLQRLGIVDFGYATTHAGGDLWDTEEPAAVLSEREQPDLAALSEMLSDPQCQHLSLLCDPVPNGQADLLAALSARKSGWAPCVLSIGWGESSLPDVNWNTTAVRFRFSLAIGGPGIPSKPEAASKAIPDLPAAQACLAWFTDQIGTPCASRVAYAS
ncbi:MAG: hypothetical protein PF961_10980 [Planctomycetota bacterium]|jgi:hypothetical protein|nr:hypothetical protein [Planctomycetota bacterium]